MVEVLPQLIDGIAVGSIYAGLALGLTLVYGLLRILHIAHAGVYVVGAYTAFYVYSYTHNLVLSISSSMITSTILGFLINRIFYKPFLEQPRYVPLMISIALFIVIEELIANFFFYFSKAFQVNFLARKNIELNGIIIPYKKILVILTILVATLFTWVLTRKTKFGVASQAVSQDPEIAMAMGVNIPFIIDFNFMLGSALAGLAGFLYGYYYGVISPFMGGVVAYKGLVIIVLGGFGSVIGSYIGGLIIGLTEQLMTAFFPHLLPREAYAFIALIVLLLFRPYGLLGRRETI